MNNDICVKTNNTKITEFIEDDEDNKITNKDLGEELHRIKRPHK